MTDQPNPALKRKTSFGRGKKDYGVVDPEGMLRVALSKAAREVLRISLEAQDVTTHRVTLSNIGEVLAGKGLLIALKGRTGTSGLAFLDGVLLSALMQALTAGHISDGDVDDRQPTETDAFMVRRFMATFLADFARRLTGHAAADWADGYAPGDRIADLSRLPHLMADVEYRCLSAQVSIASGQHTGTFAIMLPRIIDPAGNVAVDLANPAASSGKRGTLWQTPVMLEAVLHRMTLPLSKVSALAVGDVLTVPADTIGAISLEGIDACNAGYGRLGQSEGSRAIKLSKAPSESASHVPGIAPPGEAVEAADSDTASG